MYLIMSLYKSFVHFNARRIDLCLPLFRFNPRGENYTVHRTIYRENRSNWVVNKRSSTQKAVSLNTIHILFYFMYSLNVLDFVNSA